jgi:hypothetical protein
MEDLRDFFYASRAGSLDVSFTIWREEGMPLTLRSTCGSKAGQSLITIWKAEEVLLEFTLDHPRLPLVVFDNVQEFDIEEWARTEAEFFAQDVLQRIERAGRLRERLERRSIS